MAERDLLYARKSWFSDARTGVRRMGLSSHPESGLVILSLWQGDTCTATFRLPMREAPRLIAALAESLGEAAPVLDSDPEPDPDSDPPATITRIK